MTTPSWVVHHGDCLDVMRSMPDASVDAVVTDPPYGLSFMGKGWDHGVPGVHFWANANRLSKPGTHLLAFGGTRTFHRLACEIENAGWEIRDCLSWLYGSGFPKSHNGAWGGTALKPAWEPVILARKPLIGTVAANHAAHGTGALNIDGCRIAPSESDDLGRSPLRADGARSTSRSDGYGMGARGRDGEASADRRYTARGGTDFAALPGPRGGDDKGRWPANVALDEDAAAALDEQSGALQSGQEGADGHRRQSATNQYGGFAGQQPGDSAGALYGDFGGASRFFYTAKASREERGEGNTHPTVKPVDLMRWLVRLVTPIGGLVLDPFLGSGTTGVAALEEGCRFVGIEREAEYVTIARARIEAAARAPMLDFGTPVTSDEAE